MIRRLNLTRLFSAETSAHLSRVRPASFPCPSARRPLQESSTARLAQKLAVIHDHFTAREHRASIAAHREALEHGVIHAHVMRLRANGVQRGGIPNDDVGIA